MQLSKVKIHNFRGIIDGEFNLAGYGLLVGANNAGKSTVIDAIRAFYEKEGFRFKKERDFPHLGSKDNDSWIEFTFALKKEEYESLKDEYKVTSESLTVRKYFLTSIKKADGKSAAGGIFAQTKSGEISDSPFYGAKNVQSGKFGDLVYVPAVSKVDEHAKLSGPSALRDLLADILTDVAEAGASYPEFAEQVKVFSDSVGKERTTDGRSLDGFQNELNELLSPWATQFALNLNPPSVAEVIKSMIQWDLLDEQHGKPQGIESYGSGFQRHFIYSLIQMGAKYVRPKAAKKSKDFAPEFHLVLFEEPEAFLHPPQQEALARSLNAVAQASRWQVLCATHSSHFLSRNAMDIPSLVRLRRECGVVRGYQIDNQAWSDLVESNQGLNTIAESHPRLKKTLHEDDCKAEMEAIKHFLWLNPDRASAFFAGHVLLVEGATEVALINRLLGEGRIVANDTGLYVLDCLGKFNIHRFMSLLTRLGVSHAVLHDADGNGDYHRDLNKLIQESADSTLTTCVATFEKDLEHLLGIQCGGRHRKPQHVLFQYESGAIDGSAIDKFCDYVHSCIPSLAQAVVVDELVGVGAK